MKKILVAIAFVTFSMNSFASVLFSGDAATALYNCLDQKYVEREGTRYKTGEGYDCQAIRQPMSGWDRYFVSCSVDSKSILVNSTLMMIEGEAVGKLFGLCNVPAVPTEDDATTLVKKISPALDIYSLGGGMYSLNLDTALNR